MSRIEFDEWRQDITYPSGRVEKDVLFIRTTKDNVSFQVVVRPDDNLADMRLLLLEKINSFDSDR